MGVSTRLLCDHTCNAHGEPVQRLPGIQISLRHFEYTPPQRRQCAQLFVITPILPIIRTMLTTLIFQSQSVFCDGEVHGVLSHTPTRAPHN